MNELFLPVIIGVIGVSMLLIGLGMLWLLREHKKLKQNYQQLTKQMQSTGSDLAGLCSAAIAVDSRMAANETRMAYLMEGMNTPKPAPPPRENEALAAAADAQPQGYEQAIEKIRDGADVEELVKRFGLTRDEAVLLTRLHGQNRH